MGRFPNLRYVLEYNLFNVLETAIELCSYKTPFAQVCQKQAWNRYHKFECKVMKDPRIPPIPYSVRAALQLAFLMNSDAVSEEDKAGVHRLEAHDPSTLEKPCDLMQYEMTIESASDLLARVDPNHPELSRIPKYVGQVRYLLTSMDGDMLKRTDLSELVDADYTYSGPYWCCYRPDRVLGESLLRAECKCSVRCT